jgi:membrane protease YdiL (CAAX protease family)
MNENKETSSSKIVSPWIYFVATFAWTWLFWGVAIATGANMEDFGAGLILLLLGVMGPMVTGITFTYLTRDKEGRRDYWKRIINFKQIPAKWYLVIFFFVPVMHVLSALLDNMTGGGGSTWGEVALNAVSNPLSIIASILFASLIPFLEELGWRGYVLDHLQAKWNALTSSLILGVVWSLWHLPMFFIPGSYQAGLGIGTVAFWMFFLAIVPLSIIFTWIYNNTNRSTLATILFHAMVNFTGELIALSERADNFYNLLWFVAAIVIAVIWGAKTLTRKKD